jgi:hypothetical protein
MIIGVAIKDKDTGCIYSLSKPNRHHHLFPYLINLLGYDESKKIRLSGKQGFVDDKGEFYNRQDALDHANKYNQVKTKHGMKSELYSEDLW